MSTFTLDSAYSHIGKDLGTTAWMTVDQARIDEFAHCTGDDQWIHVDAERARRESPWKTTVAHGYLTLSLLAPSAFEVFLKPAGITRAFNYGLDKVRFLSPVKSGDRVRTRITLTDVQPRGDSLLLVTESTVEIDGGDKPALIAQSLVLVTA